MTWCPPLCCHCMYLHLALGTKHSCQIGGTKWGMRRQPRGSRTKFKMAACLMPLREEVERPPSEMLLLSLSSLLPPTTEEDLPTDG